MKHILIATTITASTAAVATAAAMAAATTPMRAAAAPPCKPKITKIQGHQAAVNCGPATATLHISGKTYTFRNGFCEQSKVGRRRAPAQSRHDRYSASKATRASPTSACSSVTFTRVASVFGADYGGKDLLGGDSLINVRGNIPSKGTFTSRVTTGAKFTGSWNCHGVVWQAP